MQNVHGGRQSWAQLLVPPPGHSKVSRISTVAGPAAFISAEKSTCSCVTHRVPQTECKFFMMSIGTAARLCELLAPLHVAPNATSAWKERDLVIKPGAPVCAGTQLAPPVIQQFRISVLLTIANADSAFNK